MAAPDNTTWYNDFAVKIRTALDNLVTLEIVTAVGPVRCQYVGPETMGPKSKLRPTKASLEQCTAMYSKVDLVQGDITTCIPEDFVKAENGYTQLRQFHLDREKEGRKIINDNIATLKSLLSAAADIAFRPAPAEPPKEIPAETSGQ